MSLSWAEIDELLKSASVDAAQVKTSNAELIDRLVHTAEALDKVARSSDGGAALDKYLRDIFSGEDVSTQELALRESIKNRITQLGMIAAPSA
jgi:hypothetical protein